MQTRKRCFRQVLMLNVSDKSCKRLLPLFCFTSEAMVEATNPGTIVSRIKLSNWPEENLHNKQLKMSAVTVFSPSTHLLRDSRGRNLPGTALVQQKKNAVTATRAPFPFELLQ